MGGPGKASPDLSDVIPLSPPQDSSRPPGPMDAFPPNASGNLQSASRGSRVQAAWGPLILSRARPGSAARAQVSVGGSSGWGPIQTPDSHPDPRSPPASGGPALCPPPHPPPSPPPGASKPHSARRDPARPSRGDIPRIQGDPSVATLPNLVITEPPRPLSSRPDPASPFLPPPSGRGAWLTSLAAACSRNRPASWATEGAAEGATLALVSAGLPWKTKRERQSAADEPSAASCVPGGRARCPSRSRDSEAFEQHFAIGSSV